MAKAISRAKFSYFRQLTPSDQLIYGQKLQPIDGEDPYNIDASLFSADPSKWPGISYIDIVNYLVLSPNPAYTAEQMRAYKGLDAHNQFTSGWVKDVEVSNVTETLAVVKGRVSTNYLLLCFNPTFFSSNTY